MSKGYQTEQVVPSDLLKEIQEYDNECRSHRNAEEDLESDADWLAWSEKWDLLHEEGYEIVMRLCNHLRFEPDGDDGGPYGEDR